MFFIYLQDYMHRTDLFIVTGADLEYSRSGEIRENHKFTKIYYIYLKKN